MGFAQVQRDSSAKKSRRYGRESGSGGVMGEGKRGGATKSVALTERKSGRIRRIDSRPMPYGADSEWYGWPAPLPPPLPAAPLSDAKR